MGSIKAAAKDLGVTQPAISSAIQNLEREFDAKLLERNREGSSPTHYGKALYESATQLLNVIDNAHIKIEQLKDPNIGKLRIGTGPSVSLEHLSTAINELILDFPRLEIIHTVNNDYRQFEKMLMVEEIDIAICNAPANKLPKTIEVELISENPIIAVAAAKHFTARQKKITTEVMTNHFHWVTSHDDEITPPSKLSRNTLRYRPMLIDDLELLKKLVKTGKTIAFLPQNVAREELTSGEFVQFTAKTKAVKRPIYALSLAKSDKPLFLKNFKETLKRINQKNTVDWKPRRIISITDE